MKKFISAVLAVALLGVVPAEAFAFHVRANLVARVKVQEVRQVVQVQKIVQVQQVVERVRFANIVTPAYAVQQLVLPVYQPQAFYAPPVQQLSSSCQEQLRVLAAEKENLLIERDNLRLKLQAK